MALLRRRTGRLSATGLVISSVAPDFEKFLPLGLHNGHTWASLFYFSCPVALGLAFLFHGVVLASVWCADFRPAGTKPAAKRVFGN